MQFQVPQFIQAEDKIVGPFSMRQFIYVAIGGGVSAMLYFSVGGFLWILGSILVLGLAFALAFLKIEGRPLLNILLSAVNFYWKPQTYVWQPEHPTVHLVHHKTTVRPVPTAKAPSRQKVAIGAGLHDLFAKLQVGGQSKISDKQYLEKQMESRYQIFRRETGERRAAKRIDYR